MATLSLPTPAGKGAFPLRRELKLAGLGYGRCVTPTLTPHQRRLRELESLRGLISDLEQLAGSSAVGTVPAAEVAAMFERRSSLLPAQSELLGQLERLAAALRRGPARTRVEALRQIVRKLRLQADEFAAVLEARDARMRQKG